MKQWKTDTLLREEMLLFLKEERADIENKLEALGTLVLMGEEDVARKWSPSEFEKEEASLFLENAESLEIDLSRDELVFNNPESVLHSLDARDVAELRLVGAKIILGEEADYNDDLGSSLDAMDSFMKEDKLFLNREEFSSFKINWIKPEYRGVLWWWKG